MLCGRIGLAQRYIDGLIQAEGYLIGKAIGIAAIAAAMIWYIQIWKDAMDVQTTFDAILIGAKYTDDGYLDRRRTVNQNKSEDMKLVKCGHNRSGLAARPTLTCLTSDARKSE